MPTACAAAPSRVRSSVPRATRIPRPTSPITFSCGTRTRVEGRRAGGRAVDAELVLELADREAGPVGLDDEGGDPPLLAVGQREDDVEVGDAGVGDPVLGPVDHPFVAVEHRLRAHRAGIRAGLGLREREGRASTRRSRSGAGSAASARSEPKSRIGSVPSSCTIRISAEEAQALAISSTAICCISVPVPVPPYSVGRRAGRGCRARRRARGCRAGTRRSRRSRPPAAQTRSRTIWRIVSRKSISSWGIA